MESLCQDHRVSAVCEALGMSRSGHYARSSREPSRRSREDRELGDAIERIYRGHRCVYGYPRMRLALRAEGLFHSRRRIARLMAGRSLKGRRRGRFKPWTTDSSHGLGYDPNVLAAQGPPSRPHEVWVSGTTYIKTGQGWAYLAATMDLHSRYIVGWSLSASNDGELAVSALEKASSRHGGRKVLHHSDRGSTYASNGFRQSLRDLEATGSMSAKGNCYDNAAMESFFGTLKAECVQGLEYRDLGQARQSLFSYIEGFYNTRRIHTSVGMSPLQMLGDARRSPNPSAPSHSSPYANMGIDNNTKVSNN